MKRIVVSFFRVSRVLLAVSLFSAFRSYGATLTYKVVDGVRDWSDPDGWFSGSTPAGNLPSSADYVHLTGTDLAWPNPLVVSASSFVKPTAFIVGRNAGDVASVRVDEGAGEFGICKAGGSHYNYGYCIGRAGRGLFVNNGGSVNFYANSGLYVGAAAGGAGIVSNLSGTVISVQ